MAALPSPTDPNDWSAEITADAIGEMDGLISIYDPSDMVETPYNPDDDTGGTSAPATVLSRRPARIQQLPTITAGVATEGWLTKRRVRVQIELRPGDPIISKGLVLRVDDGHKDKSLEQFAFQVLSAPNSSHAALRTIECVSELAVAPPVAAP